MGFPFVEVCAGTRFYANCKKRIRITRRAKVRRGSACFGCFRQEHEKQQSAYFAMKAHCGWSDLDRLVKCMGDTRSISMCVFSTSDHSQINEIIVAYNGWAVYKAFTEQLGRENRGSSHPSGSRWRSCTRCQSARLSIMPRQLSSSHFSPCKDAQVTLLSLWIQGSKLYEIFMRCRTIRFWRSCATRRTPLLCTITNLKG